MRAQVWIEKKNLKTVSEAIDLRDEIEARLEKHGEMSELGLGLGAISLVFEVKEDDVVPFCDAVEKAVTDYKIKKWDLYFQ